MDSAKCFDAAQKPLHILIETEISRIFVLEHAIVTPQAISVICVSLLFLSVSYYETGNL